MKSLLGILVLLSTVLSLSLSAFAQESTATPTSTNPGAEPNDSSSGKVGMTKQEAGSIALGLYPDCSACRANLVDKLLGANTTKTVDYSNLKPSAGETETPASRQNSK